MADVAIEMRDALVELAGVRQWSETRERWLERAATRAGVSYRMAKSIFYGELRDPRTSIVTRVRHAIERKSADLKESTQDEVAALEARIQILERRLGALDTNTDRKETGALGAGAAEDSRKNSPMASGLTMKENE